MKRLNPLWQPRHFDQQATAIAKFLCDVSARFPNVVTIDDLHRWSVENPADFWAATAQFCGIVWQKPPPNGSLRFSQDSTHTKSMMGASWFPGAQLNYAENLLNACRIEPNAVRVIAYREGVSNLRKVTGTSLIADVKKVASTFKTIGLTKGQRVAGVVPNTYETLVCMLATASIGAVWCSCSPDFGKAAIVERFAQVQADILVFTPDYVYGGKTIDCTKVISVVLEKLSTIRFALRLPSIRQNQTEANVSTTKVRTLDWNELRDLTNDKLEFTTCEFSDPLFIMFSSGTTGKPKCIVHSVGGTLLQHLKEHRLHVNLSAQSKLLYFTTCGWMMWNWLVSALASEATIVLYEGSVHHPHRDQLWRVVAETETTHFGTSPKFISHSMQTPGINFSSHLTQILSTGSPLMVEQFEWIHSNLPNVQIASICGGTDIISCFMLGNPLKPVYSGEIQGPGLGMDIAAIDENGREVLDVRGELICKTAFPSMPTGFWNDDIQQNAYKKAYFYNLNGREIWKQGDYVTFSSKTGGIVVLGRSDATLNPAGVRMGTAEFYGVIEKIPGVADSLVTAFRQDGDEVIVIFVVCAKDYMADKDKLFESIRSNIRSQLSPRHLPKWILPVSAVPYTRSGKKLEIAVRQVIHGEEVPNTSAIANPDALSEIQAVFKRVIGE